MTELPTTPPRRDRAWWRPFLGFYRPREAGLSELGPVIRFLYAARSVILVISAQAAIIAGLLAVTDRAFSPVDFVLVFFGFVIAHAISNLSNDYFGYRRGHDSADSPRMRYTIHPIASGALTQRQFLTGLGLLCAVGVGIAAYLVAARGPIALGFALGGAALLYLYDAAPKPLKSLGLGEVAAFAVWGPLMVGGGYYVITGTISGAAFAASVPYGLGVMSILVGKHIDQLDFDRGAHQRTLPVVLGPGGARRLDQAAIAAMYAVIAVLVGLGVITPFALIAFVALPRAVRAVGVLHRPRPDEPPEGYVGWPLWYHRLCLLHNRVFGWAFIVGLAVGAAVPSLGW